MTWRQRHTLRRQLKSSLWPIPFACMLAGILAGRWLSWIDVQLGWTLNISADTARSIGMFLAGSLLSFIVFIFTVLLVAVQLASAQFSPRVIARVFNDRITKYALGIFVFVFTYSLVFLLRVRESVPLLSGMLCGYGSLLSVAVFLFLIDRLGKELRPVRILTGVASEARQVIRQMYPVKLNDAGRAAAPAQPIELGAPKRVIEHRGSPGVILAFDDFGLVRLAQQANCVIELVPQVGDFIAADDELFRIYAGGESIDERQLLNSIALGPERTLEQDPMFAIRIIVDIASKALSPAINDPTTAVLALDQLHHLLKQVGERVLDDGQDLDSAGVVRLIYRTPNWEDFAHLAITEIRHFGGQSIQVARRLRGMLEHLMQTLPAERRVLLCKELDLLQRSAQRSFLEPEDRAMAEVGDAQGVGGSLERNSRHDGADHNQRE
jgi:uncharacterized membrane protein